LRLVWLRQLWLGCGLGLVRLVVLEGGVSVPFGPPSANQGPTFSAAADYPYVPGSRPYYGHYAFHDPAYMNPRNYHVPHARPVYYKRPRTVAHCEGPLRRAFYVVAREAM